MKKDLKKGWLNFSILKFLSRKEEGDRLRYW